MTETQRQIDIARKSLLDLTNRNRLINFKLTKNTSLKVVDELPTEIYNLLVIQEKSMAFKATIENLDDTKSLDLFTNVGNKKNDNSFARIDDSELPKNYTDLFLQTDQVKEKLSIKLRKISQDARAILEEQGYNILYLALGFLEYEDVEHERTRRKAPLILVPIELYRTKVKSDFKIKWTGEEILHNFALKEKLIEQGIILPDFEMPDEKSELDRYFNRVEKEINTHENWQVNKDIYLSFFSFAKFVMYKDLDADSWSDIHLSENKLLEGLFEKNEEILTANDFNEDDIDKKLETKKLFHILDADPSQICVIENAKAGKNLVVEGPPGTGKSQTIANIIAELLANEKTVLFVCEKMAALEVVKKRLDQTGIGQFCLELHSKKTNKNEFLKELEKCAFTTSETIPTFDTKFSNFEILKNELNDYAKTLRTRVGNLEFNVYELLMLKEKSLLHFERVKRNELDLSIGDWINITSEDYTEAIKSLNDLSQTIQLVQPINKNPWKWCAPNQIILPSDVKIIKEKLNYAIRNLTLYANSLKFLSTLSGIRIPRTMSNLKEAVNAAVMISKAGKVDENVLLNEEWNTPSNIASKIVETIRKIKNLKPIYSQKFRNNASGCDIVFLLKEYKETYNKIFKIFYPRYYKTKKMLKSIYLNSIQRNKYLILEDLLMLKEYINAKNYIKNIETKGLALFGTHWNGENSNPEMLEYLSGWLVSFRKELVAQTLSNNSLKLVSNGISKENIVKTLKKLKTEYINFAQSIKTLDRILKPNYDKYFEMKFENADINKIYNLLKMWEKHTDRIQKWTQFLPYIERCRKTIAWPIADYLFMNNLYSEDIVPSFQSCFADFFIRHAFETMPTLNNFVANFHQKRINSFIEIDQELIKLNRVRLYNKLSAAKPKIFYGISPDSEVGLLVGEFNKKRRHMPIRRLLSAIPKLVQKIKPCFMMSPISIAQYLKPGNVKFDVIIFDEASQIKPQDSLGAFLRAKQAIVIGDTRQLPPTSFFDFIVDSEDDGNFISSISDLDSILHLCKQRYPTLMLKWHYRSKHESLIAVSNNQFYENKLLVYPSATSQSEKLGLHLKYYSDTVYDRGKSQKNLKEAQIVAKAAFDHFKRSPDKSLGIGTFSIKQQEAILDYIELMLQKNPEMENHFSSQKEENFFVKNLETIQGDERDVIFISIGYGKDVNGRITNNFGPLNHDGGERRLNVLITRAREKTVVFSNFRAIDMQYSNGFSKGVKSLKLFMQYAESKEMPYEEQFLEDADSPFEEAVCDFLVDNGFEVRKQVGCTGFRVDLAIVDAKAPGKYLLGIECDGAKYHSSPVARDRDRLRQQILEQMGWVIYRIWSTDWYRNRNEAQKELLAFIQSLNDREDVGNDKDVNIEKNGKEEEEKSKINNCITTYKPTNFIKKTKKYKMATQKDTIGFKSFDLCEEFDIAKIITQIVKIESPIHNDYLINRLRIIYELKRIGERIMDKLESAISFAVRSKMIKRDGDFYLEKYNKKITPRYRQEKKELDLSKIYTKEIEQAIKFVLKHQLSTSLEDLLYQAAKVIGFKTVNLQTKEKIKRITLEMLTNYELEFDSNDFIKIAKNDSDE